MLTHKNMENALAHVADADVASFRVFRDENSSRRVEESTIVDVSYQSELHSGPADIVAVWKPKRKVHFSNRIASE